MLAYNVRTLFFDGWLSKYSILR